MSPAASTHRAAMAVPTPAWVTAAWAPSGPSGRRAEWDSETTANEMSRTIVRAAAAATTATLANDAQSMCMDDAPLVVRRPGQAARSGGQVEVRRRRRRDVVDVVRGDRV